MKVFKPEQLRVVFTPSTTPIAPVYSRKYTLTHSDVTGELFLSIGDSYDYRAINFALRDEVLAEWMIYSEGFLLLAKAYISSGEYDKNMSQMRYLIFKKEMDLAITGIIYGDKSLYLCYPWLLDAPIYVHFASIYPEFNKLEYFGTPRRYLNTANKMGLKSKNTG